MKKHKKDKIITFMSYKHSMLTKAMSCLLVFTFIVSNVNHSYAENSTLRRIRENLAVEEALRAAFSQPGHIVVNGNKLRIVPLTPELMLEKQDDAFRLQDSIAADVVWEKERDVIAVAQGRTDGPIAFNPELKCSFAVLDESEVMVGIAFFSSYDKRDGYVYLETFAVSQELHGSPVASWLLLYSLRQAQKQGFTAASWITREKLDSAEKAGVQGASARAVDFYEKIRAKRDEEKGKNGRIPPKEETGDDRGLAWDIKPGKWHIAYRIDLTQQGLSTLHDRFEGKYKPSSATISTANSARTSTSRTSSLLSYSQLDFTLHAEGYEDLLWKLLGQDDALLKIRREELGWMPFENDKAYERFLEYAELKRYYTGNFEELIDPRILMVGYNGAAAIVLGLVMQHRDNGQYVIFSDTTEIALRREFREAVNDYAFHQESDPRVQMARFEERFPVSDYVLIPSFVSRYPIAADELPDRKKGEVPLLNKVKAIRSKHRSFKEEKEWRETCWSPDSEDALLRTSHRNFPEVKKDESGNVLAKTIQGQTLAKWADEYNVKRVQSQYDDEYLRHLIAWIIELTYAAKYLKQRRLVHCDFGPHNVMIEDGTLRPIVIDFDGVERGDGAEHVVLEALNATLVELIQERILAQNLVYDKEWQWEMMPGFLRDIYGDDTLTEYFVFDEETSQTRYTDARKLRTDLTRYYKRKWQTSPPARTSTVSTNEKFYAKAQEVFGLGGPRSPEDFNPERHRVWEEERWRIVEKFFRSNDISPYAIKTEPLQSTIMVSSTDGCSIDCGFCLADASPKNTTYINAQHLSSFLSSLEEHYENLWPLIYITGGEPTFHMGHFLGLLDEVGGCVAGIATNAWFVTHPGKASDFIKNLGSRLDSLVFGGFLLAHDSEHPDWVNGGRLRKNRDFINAGIKATRNAFAFANVGLACLRGDDPDEEARIIAELLSQLDETYEPEKEKEKKKDTQWIDRYKTYNSLQSTRSIRYRVTPLDFEGKGFLSMGNEGYVPAPYSEEDIKKIESAPSDLWGFTSNISIAADGIVVPFGSLMMNPKPIRLTKISREDALDQLLEKMERDPIAFSCFDKDAFVKLLDLSREFDKINGFDYTDRVIRTPLFLRKEGDDPIESARTSRTKIAYWLFINPERKLYITLRFLQEKAKERAGGDRIEIADGVYHDSTPDRVYEAARAMVDKRSEKPLPIDQSPLKPFDVDSQHNRAVRSAV